MKTKTEVEKVESERLSKLTFEEKIVELRKLGYQIGQGEATGVSNGVTAKTTLNGTVVTGATLSVVHEGTKYNVALDLIDRSLWDSKALEVGEILGVTFNTEELAALSPQGELEVLAKAAALKAGGTFTPKK